MLSSASQPHLLLWEEFEDFGPVQDDGSHGEVFTRRWVVELILDLAGYVAESDLGTLVAVEPSCGSGAFLIPMVERLSASLRAHGRHLREAHGSIRATDLLPRNVETSRTAVAATLKGDGWSTAEAHKAAKAWVTSADYLLSARSAEPADFVLGNPPYIRMEDLDPRKAAAYRRSFSTMVGRADIYVAFYERGLLSLNPDGRLAFICADRWMRNHYGSGLRGLIAEGFSLDLALEAHDVDAFEEDVSAYPAITVVRRAAQASAVIVSADRAFDAVGASELLAWWNSRASLTYAGPGFQAAQVPNWHEGSGPWPTGTPAQLLLLEDLNARFRPLQDPATGTKVGIGVATGADAIYVVQDPPDIEDDRLLPMAMSRDTRTGTLTWSGHYLINPWAVDGSLVSLTDYPKLGAYFESKSESVLARRVGRLNPDGWYRTIDKVDANLINRPKLFFPDMKMTSHPVLDPGGLYPHHNLYFLVSDKWDLRVLGGLLLSRVAQFFIESYAVRMRGGTLRFQAQYLRRIRVPDPDSISSELANELAAAFDARDEARATQAALDVYGLSEIPGVVSRSSNVVSSEGRTATVTDSNELVQTVVAGAVGKFWTGRTAQAEKQRLSGKLDAGTRGAVTGGGHLDGIRDIIADVFVAQGLPPSSIRRSQSIVLPGFYRPTKKWDLLVVHERHLVAAVELKSQVGPSFGNNFNNRVEEALGNATDIWRAYEEGTLGDVRPWLGYVFILEEADGSTKPVRVEKSVYPAEPIFDGTSYKDRYGILCDRLVKERLYDAAWFVAANAGGHVEEPKPSLDFANLVAGIAGRVAYVRTLLG